MSRLRQCSALRRLIGVALLSLVLGQWTALVHAIEHAVAPAAATDATASHNDDSWSHQAGTPACLLLDHLLAGQAPAGPSATMPGDPPAATRLTAPEPPIGLGPLARAYEARGPPRA